ncbi:MAG: cytochrome c3 family protein [Pyrinomonadaceae bacterium]
MKNLAKLIVVSLFGLGALFVFSCAVANNSAADAQVAAKAAASPTPPANAAANTAAKPPAGSSDKKITKSFMLGKDSLSEYGEAPFDHETHAEGKYSPDGKSVVACIECHHTDQPKSALKPPLATSEREVALTMETWKASTQKVNECRSCHFQEGNVPDGKVMPELNGKVLNNEYSYHVNCNVCHDAAFKARPELKGKKGFATSKDCLICHTKN